MITTYRIHGNRVRLEVWSRSDQNNNVCYDGITIVDEAMIDSMIPILKQAISLTGGSH